MTPNTQASMITVAHFVTPYLFRTGSWIHSQLALARTTRPIVFTRRLENPAAFPFEPIVRVPASPGRLGPLADRLRFLRGDLTPRGYLPALRRHRVALIHAHMGWEGARAVPVARAAGLPLITSFYGRDAGRLPRYPWWRLLYRRLFRAGSLFLVEGPALGRRLQALGCPPRKIRVVHLGIDLSRIPFAERYPPREGPIEILVSASLRPKKGVPDAVDAFAALASSFPRAHLRILGDGPERRRVRERIEHHHLSARVTSEGYVPYERHLAALTQAHIFLAPSRTSADGDSEGGAPVSLIEAQASGLPIVSTRHADIPEVVAAGASGLLSPEYDLAALIRNLQWMLAHPEQWPAMGRSGRARMEAEFDASRQVATSEAIYREIT
ncbi:MAG: glycosyltransferase [Candidatus Eisenbacteria bacterium]|nr:glycosyltransferase [Candidatus Eisenbacteria bacterium]